MKDYSLCNIEFSHPVQLRAVQIEHDKIHALLRDKQKTPRGVKLRGILNLPTWADFIVIFQFSLHNFAEAP